MRVRGSVLRVIAPLIALNLIAWALALAIFREQPVLLGACALAWTLGLRHAVDADHIAAIDGATRRLMHGSDGSARSAAQPMLTGLYFSLGHSTVVWIASLGVALAASNFSPVLGGIERIGSVIGPGTSIVFLFAIALANIAVLAGLLRAASRRRSRGADNSTIARHDLDDRLIPGGPIARMVRPLFRLVTRSRHMFAIGVLFGLGFDTASEIMVLGISASAATHGTAIWSILLFPALFTAAMALVDTLDSAMMTRAYGWAFDQPHRKLTYNIAITALSVVLALVIGMAEVVAALPGAGHEGFVAAVLENGGYAALVLFAIGWLFAQLLSRIVNSRTASA